MENNHSYAYICVRSNEDSREQENQIQKYAQEKGIEITRVFRDCNKGGRHLKRQGLTAMIQEIKRIRNATVICFSIGSIGRNVNEIVRNLALCHEFHSINDRIVIKQSDEINEVAKFVALLENFQKKALSDKIKSGMRTARVANGISIGRPRLQLDADEVKRLHSSGRSIRQIAKYLNNVSPSSVFRSLKDSGYAGITCKI